MERQSDIIFLDTHVVVWLYDNMLDEISKTGRELLEKCDVVISPMSVLELQYLNEAKKITTPRPKIISFLEHHINLQIDDIDFATVAEAAYDIKWTRDPFDRIIVANASVHGARLLSKDRRITANYELALC